MKKMKMSLLSIAMLLISIVLVACQTGESSTKKADVLAQIIEKGELNVGIAPGYPPYEFYILDENGERKIAGSDTDLAQAIADEIGVNLTFTATDFNGVVVNIQASSVDMGISGFNYTQERAKMMQFSEGYLQEQSTGFQGIMMQKENAAEFNSLDEIKKADLVFGAQGGSIQYELASDLTDESNLKQYNTLDVGLAALNEGDIDGMVVSTSSAEPMLITFPGLTILSKEDFDLDPEQVYSTNMIAFPQGEEYEPHIERGNIVYAGVDYEAILEAAENDPDGCDVILWDGGNNDFSFYEADLAITVVDPHRPGHELSYYPGEVSLQMADVVIINKVDSTTAENIAIVEKNEKK